MTCGTFPLILENVTTHFSIKFTGNIRWVPGIYSFLIKISILCELDKGANTKMLHDEVYTNKILYFWYKVT